MQNSFACGNLGNLSNVQIGLLSEFNLRSKMLNSLYKFSETFNFYKKDFDSFKNLSIRSKEINHWSKTFTFLNLCYLGPYQLCPLKIQLMFQYYSLMNFN